MLSLTVLYWLTLNQSITEAVMEQEMIRRDMMLKEFNHLETFSALGIRQMPRWKKQKWERMERRIK